MIAVLGAMEGEITEILGHLGDRREEVWRDFVFHHGLLAGREVVVARSGVGKTLSALVTQRLCDSFAPQAVIFTGLAGALNQALEVGDTVVARDCLQHDVDATALGFQRGELPYSPYRVLACDPGLVQAASTYVPAEGRVFLGRVLTGDQFITDKASHAYLRSELAGDAIEMEGASVGLTATVNRLPFLLVRTISDRADGSASVDFSRFLPRASRNSAACLLHILSCWEA